MPPRENIYKLDNRALLAVQGADAEDFLQNILTNDITRLSDAVPLQYNLLLSPQGQVLQDLFVWRRGADDFVLDVFAARKADMLRRLSLFKLRAKVTISEIEDLHAFAGEAAGAMADPRMTDLLPPRLYAAHITTVTDSAQAYDDLCIALGVPPSAAFFYEKDYTHDLGLEKLNAIAWDKGCFIGQEVAARVEHRGLSKKALCRIQGQGLQAGAVLTADGGEAGDIRRTNSDGTQALAVLKKMALAGDLSQSGRPVKVF